MSVSVEKGLGTTGTLVNRPILNREIVARRVAAFLADSLIFFVFTGVVFDPVLWGMLAEFATHLVEIGALHPWLFHAEHLPHVTELAARMVGIYAHVFFAVFITLTLMDAYRGQTPGRFLLGIRVVSVSNRRLELVESGIRNIGKVFLLPLDLIVGVIFLSKHGYMRFFDYYTRSKIVMVREETPVAEK